jgi:hypothetical protein
MRWLIILISLFATNTSFVYAETGKKIVKIQKPRLMLISTDPWLMVIGSDMPQFVLYDSGLTIFQKKNSDKATLFLYCNLNQTEQKALIDASKSLLPMNDDYELTEVTDQPNNSIYITFDQTKRVSVYGNLSKTEIHNQAPKPFLALYDRLISFQHKDAKPWMPEYIEVMIWPFEYSRDEIIPWPKSWPDINDPLTKKRGESYCLFLKSEYLPQLKNLLQNMRSSQAILMDGKKWTLSYRFPFPHEKCLNK